VIKHLAVLFLLISNVSGIQICKAEDPISSKPKKDSIVQFLFTSDVHFGLTKEHFRNRTNVSSAEVNLAMIESMNSLPDSTAPMDGGVNAGQKIKSIDAIAITGDIANREETGIQSASASWKEFETDYKEHLHVFNAQHQPAALLLTPGNHDISNAVGFTEPCNPCLMRVL